MTTFVWIILIIAAFCIGVGVGMVTNWHFKRLLEQLRAVVHGEEKP